MPIVQSVADCTIGDLLKIVDMNPTKTESIKRFLELSTHADLAALYNHDMEAQVYVEQDGGEYIEGVYNEITWKGWTDGFQVWKQIRIPYAANSNPHYEDGPMAFDLAQHATGIGMTGWDWKNKISKWVGFDFDALEGHSDSHQKKLTPEQLQEVKDATFDIPWVTIRHPHQVKDYTYMYSHHRL